MTIIKLIRVVQQVLVKSVLYSGLDETYRLAFITVFNIKVVVAYFFTPAFISVVDKF